MGNGTEITVSKMIREWPIRSAINVLVPLLFAVGQFANSYYFDVSLVYPAVFTVLLIGMAVLVLQQQFAAFRSSRINRHTAGKV